MSDIQNRNDRMDVAHITQVLAEMQVGIWSIELPDVGAPRMYGNDTMYQVLGAAPGSMTPEQLYEHWTGHIDPKYMSVVMQAVAALRQGLPTEVKYIWLHPEKGWNWVRCGGYRDDSCTDGVRFKGWHYDLTNELETEFSDVKHEIVAPDKLKLYSSFIIENIEELYEIDAETLRVNTIFYEKNRYRHVGDGESILYMIRSRVHPDHVDMLSSVFKPASLYQIFREKQPRLVEYKLETIFGEYCWVEVNILPVSVAGSNKLLFCISDISDKKRVADLTTEKNELVDAFYNLYYSIIELNLRTETAHVLKGDAGMPGQVSLPISELYELIVADFTMEAEKAAIKKLFDLQNLREIVARQENYSFDFQAREQGREPQRERIELLHIPGSRDKLYLVFSDVSEKYIMNSILKSFVFNNNDYLFYIDVKTNSFLSFHRSNDRDVLPPPNGDDYVAAMIDYNREHVVQEDQARVTEMMMPDYMLSRLRSEGSYRIELGLLDRHGSYRRKEVLIQSYDLENQILFMSRRDITKEYFRKKKEKETLATAHRLALTDPLTGLYNRKGASAEIEARLAEIGGEVDAFLMMDLDNFKAVNDSLGHLQGDELLKRVGQALRENFRRTDVIARLGGDEFVVYMIDVKNPQIVAHSAEKLLKKLAPAYPWSGAAVSASIGIAMAPADGRQFEELYVKADKALYDAKRQGKNRFSFFTQPCDPPK